MGLVAVGWRGRSGWYRRAAVEDAAGGGDASGWGWSVERVERELDGAAAGFGGMGEDEKINNPDRVLRYLRDAHNIYLDVMNSYNMSSARRHEIEEVVGVIHRHVDMHYPGDRWMDVISPDMIDRMHARTHLMDRWAKTYAKNSGFMPRPYISQFAKRMEEVWDRRELNATISTYLDYFREREGAWVDRLIDEYGDEVPQAFRNFQKLKKSRPGLRLAPESVERLKNFHIQMLHKYYWRDYGWDMGDEIEDTIRNGDWDRLYPMLATWKKIQESYISQGELPENKFPNNETYNRLEGLYRMLDSSTGLLARAMLTKTPDVWNSMYENNRDLFRRVVIWLAVHKNNMDGLSSRNLVRIIDGLRNDTGDYMSEILEIWVNRRRREPDE
jgi:hypothetical protein